MTRHSYRIPAMVPAWKCPPGKKLPPYGKALAEAFMQGLMPTDRQCVVYLDRWPPRPGRIAVCCPPDTSPEVLDLRILAGLDVRKRHPQAVLTVRA